MYRMLGPDAVPQQQGNAGNKPQKVLAFPLEIRFTWLSYAQRVNNSPSWRGCRRSFCKLLILNVKNEFRWTRFKRFPEAQNAF